MTSQVLAETSLTPSRGRFFGEPGALAYLAFTEAWERFSYYGMTALLVLYMSQALLLSPHVEQVAGFGAFRAGVEAVFGKMSTLALASQIMGLYTGFVYFTPVLGGWLADRFIGRRRAVVCGAVLMSAGHLAMAFDASFLLALILLIVGCGFLKGNISSQVGELYAEDDGEGRTRAFAIFSTAINVGAVAGPLVCGLLAQIWGWHAGFALAGVLMLFGLATYLAGYRHMPPDRPRGPEAPKAPLTRREWGVVGALAVAAALTIFQSVAYGQNTNMNLIWIDQNVDMMLLGLRVPVSWFASIDSGVSILSVPLLFALWRWQGARAGGEPGDLDKIATGALISAVANLLLVAACLIGGRISILWPLTYDVLLGVAFIYYWPTLLALVSRAAPAGIKATLMGAVFLSAFIANMILGRLGGFYEAMTPAAFWGLHAAIATVGAVLAVALKGPLERRLGTAKNV